MNYFLLCFSCTLSVYFPLRTVASSEMENEQPIDDFIEKLLKSDKFDVLASKIAEKAVETMVKIQNENFPNATKSEPVYRVNRNESKASENRSSEHVKHISDEITSLFDKNSPFNDLSLKYVKLIEKKPPKQGVRSKTTDRENKTSTRGVTDETDKIKDVGSDWDNNVYGQHHTTSEDDTRITKRTGKIKKNKKKSKPKRSRQTTAITTQVTLDDNSNEEVFNQTSFESTELQPLNTTDMQSGENNHYTYIGANLEETTPNKDRNGHTKGSVTAKNDMTNLTNNKTKRILEKANDRVYVFASSSEYDDLYIQNFNR